MLLLTDRQDAVPSAAGEVHQCEPHARFALCPILCPWKVFHFSGALSASFVPLETQLNLLCNDDHTTRLFFLIPACAPESRFEDGSYCVHNTSLSCVRITFKKVKVWWICAPQRGAVEGISVSFLTAVIQ